MDAGFLIGDIGVERSGKDEGGGDAVCDMVFNGTPGDTAVSGGSRRVMRGKLGIHQRNMEFEGILSRGRSQVGIGIDKGIYDGGSSSSPSNVGATDSGMIDSHRLPPFSKVVSHRRGSFGGLKRLAARPKALSDKDAAPVSTSNRLRLNSRLRVPMLHPMKKTKKAMTAIKKPKK